MEGTQSLSKIHVLRLVLRTQPRSYPSSFSRTQLRLFLAPQAPAG
jgi:hypothetical protein